MTEPTVLSKSLLDGVQVYIGECCREWPMAAGATVGRCGLCGERPTFKRYDDQVR